MPSKKTSKKRSNKRRSKKSTALVTLSKKVNKLSTMVYSQADDRWLTKASVNIPIQPGLVTCEDFLGLQTIAAGDEHYQRQGNVISLKGFSVKGILRNSLVDVFNKIRIIIVQIETLRDTPTIFDIKIEDILEPDVTDPTSIAPTILSHYRKNSQYKYKILYDDMYQTQVTQAGAVRPNNYMYNKTHYFKTPVPIHYESSSPDIPVQNFVGMFLISDSQIAPHPLMTMNTRVNWIG